MKDGNFTFPGPPIGMEGSNSDLEAPAFSPGRYHSRIALIFLKELQLS